MALKKMQYKRFMYVCIKYVSVYYEINNLKQRKNPYILEYYTTKNMQFDFFI